MIEQRRVKPRAVQSGQQMGLLMPCLILNIEIRVSPEGKTIADATYW
jgi:hypothetical protein